MLVIIKLIRHTVLDETIDRIDENLISMRADVEGLLQSVTGVHQEIQVGLVVSYFLISCIRKH